MLEIDPWLKIRRTNITSIEHLAAYLQLDDEKRARLLHGGGFSLNLPLHLAGRIEKNNLEDPLLRQFVPLVEEGEQMPGFTCDPVGELNFRLSPHLLQKYQGRALLIPTPVCGMHCRYCFRRHFSYAKGRIDLSKELVQIADDPTLTEVILSGGDPLSLPNAQLSSLLDSLEAIPHVQRIRFHTRLPIGIPERLNATFWQLLTGRRAQMVFVLHTNHPKELDAVLLARLISGRLAGVILLTQSVLLKGVNDSFDPLFTLFTTLANHGIIPYYLHQLDPVQGASHFHVPKEKGLSLMAQLQKHLPGYALPRFVQEIPDQPHKTILY